MIEWSILALNSMTPVYSFIFPPSQTSLRSFLSNHCSIGDNETFSVGTCYVSFPSGSHHMNCFWVAQPSLLQCNIHSCCNCFILHFCHCACGFLEVATMKFYCFSYQLRWFLQIRMQLDPALIFISVCVLWDYSQGLINFELLPDSSFTSVLRGGLNAIWRNELGSVFFVSFYRGSLPELCLGPS